MIEDTMQQTEKVEGLLPLQSVRMGAILMPPSRGRGKHLSPIPLVARNPSEIKVRSDQLTSRILLSLLDGKKYTKNPADRLAEYTQTLPHGRGSVRIVFSPHNEESWEHVLASLNILGDELVDTFLVLLAVALDTHGTEHITLPFALTPDDILVICQKKKSKGSYSNRQRQNVIEQVQTLARASVYATLTLPWGKPWHVESPLLEIIMTARPDESRSGQKDEWRHQWHLKIGNWAAMVPELQSQTAMMARQILQYHAKAQKHEKRLGRYLTLLYRINAHKNKGRVKVSMSVLLEQSGITLDRHHPGRTRERIESSLKQLHTDGVIGSFAPLVEDSAQGREAKERIEQHAYHWWDDYQRQLWLFESPPYLKELYRSRPRKAGVPD